MDITICIPTFNRPESLARVLEHLATFNSPPEEVIIGDNSGTGSAEGVADRFRSEFKSLVYLHRNANVGFMRNIDSITRIGTQPYVYVLSDDDFVYENALSVMQGILESQGQVIAVNGGYSGTACGIISKNMDYSEATASIFHKGQHQILWTTVAFCDNHPLLRRINLLSHGFYRNKTTGLIPLLFDLLQHGDLVRINAPVLQHEQRGDSISSKIASPEIIDMCNSDLEVVASRFNLIGYDINTTPGKVMQNIYFQGARMQFSQHKYLDCWHSLVRANAYQSLSAATKAWAEKHILPYVLSERIAQIAADTGCTGIESPNDQRVSFSWIKSINDQFMSLQERVYPVAGISRKLVLLSDLEGFEPALSKVPFYLGGQVHLFALGKHPLRIETSGGTLSVTSDNTEWQNLSATQNDPQIIVLRAPYAC